MIELVCYLAISELRQLLLEWCALRDRFADERLRFRWELRNGAFRCALFMRLLDRIDLLTNLGSLFLPGREFLLVFGLLFGRGEIEIIARKDRREKCL